MNDFVSIEIVAEQSFLCKRNPNFHLYFKVEIKIKLRIRNLLCSSLCHENIFNIKLSTYAVACYIHYTWPLKIKLAHS